jgi:hypothetical protein
MQTRSQASSATITIPPTVAPTITPVRALAVRPLLLAMIGDWVGEVVEVVVMGFDVMVAGDIDVDSDIPFEETVKIVVRVLLKDEGSTQPYWHPLLTKQLYGVRRGFVE